MSVQGNLYLIPVPVSDAALTQSIPEYNLTVIRSLKKFICENSKMCRQFLKKAGYVSLPDAQLLELNEHSKPENKGEYLRFIEGEESVGLMSDAGCPGIADPGSMVVALAHERGIQVIPLVGPSAIVLSIMASGFNGQNFAFNGYLPIDKTARIKSIKELEQRAIKQNQAQFFIETPYRNSVLFEQLMSSLQPSTRLYIGRNLMGEGQTLLCKKTSEWKKSVLPDLNKIPVVFGLYI